LCPSYGTAQTNEKYGKKNTERRNLRRKEKKEYYYLIFCVATKNLLPMHDAFLLCKVHWCICRISVAV
jgi:hypothetical protein